MAESKLHLIAESDFDLLAPSSVPAALAALPLTNVQSPDRGKVARWDSSPTGIVIKQSNVSAGDANKYASGFGIAHHDFADDVTVRLRLYDAIDQGGSVVYDSGNLPVAKTIPWGTFVAGVDTWGATYSLGIPAIFSTWFAATSYKSLQIDIINPTATTVDIGRVYLGYAFVPTANFSYGGPVEWVDNSKQDRTDGGGLRTTDIVSSFRRFVIPLVWMSDANRERLSWILERATKSGDMLLTLDPNATGREALENTAICKRVSNNKFSRTHKNINMTNLTVEES